MRFNYFTVNSQLKYVVENYCFVNSYAKTNTKGFQYKNQSKVDSTESYYNVFGVSENV